MAPPPGGPAREYARWTVAGALLGLLLGLAHAPHPWSGQTAAVVTEAVVSAVIVGLIACAACWFWLKRRGA